MSVSSYITKYTKTVEQLMEMNFFIPEYQRGYRWEEQQVKDLIRDINDFSEKARGEDEWYCLQPIIVRKCSNEDKEKFKLEPKDWYEVIDGQQRLTTLFLIMQYANEMWIGKQKAKRCVIKYQTRPYSSDFLNDMSIEKSESSDISNQENIDYYHIARAYSTIDQITTKEIKGFDDNQFQSVFKKHSRIIWYEPPREQSPVKTFIRINKGKIPLNNAELVKSLFLNKAKYANDILHNKEIDSNGHNHIYLRQLQIATEWDNIENMLQNNSFWAFIYNKDTEYDAHIEYIFDLMQDKSSTEKDDFFTFKKFIEDFESDEKDNKNQKDILENRWRKIKNFFQIFEEWYRDRTLYHLVGYIINMNIKEAREIMAEYNNCSTKKDFEKKLRDIIKNEINTVWPKDNNNNIDILDINKTDHNKNSKLVVKLLLLHNIETVLQDRDEEGRRQNSHFSFNEYKNNKWSIEHIHALKSKEIDNEQDFKSWTDGLLEGNALKNIKNQIQEIVDSVSTLKSKVEDINNLVSDSEDDTMRNLALLTHSVNSALNNALFKKKRQLIIELGKGGVFIPPCTRNVFLKYYTANVRELIQWGDEDKIGYLDDIKDKLKEYLPMEINNE